MMIAIVVEAGGVGQVGDQVLASVDTRTRDGDDSLTVSWVNVVTLG